MSGDSNHPPTSMDVDAKPANAGGVPGAHPGAETGASGSIPSSAHAASVTISHATSSAHSAATDKGTSSNAMDTDSRAEKHTVGSSTDSASPSTQTGPGGNAGKKFYGAFSKYAAAHPIAAISSATSPSNTHHTALSSKADVKPSSAFDIKKFLAPYEGITVVDRLLYIGERCNSLSGRAYQMALDELKTTENTTLYRHLVERLNGFPGLHFDMQWMDMKNAQAAQHFERLELELSSYKANLIKDNVRLASRELGDFHFARGDYGSALRAYSRMRDYCSAPAHHTDMNVCQARTCLALQSFSQLLTHVARAEQQPDLDAGLANQLKCWAALSYLADRKYKVAARRFLEIRLDKIPSTINQTIALNDIAKYATLLALAEFDRTELKTKVLNNPDFTLFLEKEPLMLEFAQSFYESKYGRCMSILNQIVPDLRLDFRIGDHIDTLAKHIRARALIQYFTPFSSVDMVEMAKAFETDVATLEKDIAELIVSGSISARIDSHNKRLHATESDQRSSTFEKSYHAGDSFRAQSMAMLLRVNLIRHNFVVKSGKGQGGGPGLDFMDVPGFAMNLGMAMRGHKGR